MENRSEEAAKASPTPDVLTGPILAVSPEQSTEFAPILLRGSDSWGQEQSLGAFGQQQEGHFQPAGLVHL